MWLRVLTSEDDMPVSVEAKTEYAGQRGGFVLRFGTSLKADLTYAEARSLFLALQDALTAGVDE